MDTQKIDEFIKKAQESKEKQLDLSSDEDLSLAIMNLVSLEEHFFFSGAKTNKAEFYALLKETREMRKELLRKLVIESEGDERWCISKHLLAASMRLMEVGTKQLGQGKKAEAEDLFQKSYQLYSLFWGVAKGLISTADIKSIDENALNKHDTEKKGFLSKLGDLVKRAINCCKE